MAFAGLSLSSQHHFMTNFDHPNFDIRHDSVDDVKNLLKSAKKKREDRLKWHLLGEALNGKTINVTNNPELFEALNRERMEFEDIMKLHPEEVNNCLEYVKNRKLQQDGKWWNTESGARWGEKGAIPECVYFSRPSSYWRNHNYAMFNHFLNLYPKFRIAEKKV
jgi:hypothetical protein